MKLKIILAGTPNFSVKIFENIILEHEVLAIITQPDIASGRGMKINESPVKKLAQKYNIKVFQPHKIQDIYEDLEKMSFDFFLTCAFGQMIPDSILKLAKFKSLNIHGSLLPKYRGAAPIQRAIMNQDKVTGVTLIEMVKKMDAGDMFFKHEIRIENNYSSKKLFEIMSSKTSLLINDWLIKISKNEVVPIKQNENEVTFANKLTKDEAFLDIDYSKNMIAKINAFNDNPGAYIFDDNKRIKIFYAQEEEVKNSYKIKTLDGFIYALIFQREGKKITDVSK